MLCKFGYLKELFFSTLTVLFNKDILLVNQNIMESSVYNLFLLSLCIFSLINFLFLSFTKKTIYDIIRVFLQFFKLQLTIKSNFPYISKSLINCLNPMLTGFITVDQKTFQQILVEQEPDQKFQPQTKTFYFIVYI